MIIHQKYIRNNIYRNARVFFLYPISAEQNDRIMMAYSDDGNQHSTCERQDDWYPQSRLIWFTPALGGGLRKLTHFVLDCNGRWRLRVRSDTRLLVDKDVSQLPHVHSELIRHVLKWKTDNDFDFRKQSCLLCSFPLVSGVRLLIDCPLGFHFCAVICSSSSSTRVRCVESS